MLTEDTENLRSVNSVTIGRRTSRIQVPAMENTDGTNGKEYSRFIITYCQLPVAHFPIRHALYGFTDFSHRMYYKGLAQLVEALRHKTGRPEFESWWGPLEILQ